METSGSSEFVEIPRLLIAEDDAEMRSWLNDLLAPVKCVVKLAANGWDLLDIVAEEGPFNLIVTDVRMPGPSGLQVVEMARTAGLQTPFLVITAFPDERVRLEASRMVRVELLEKPFVRAQFFLAVTRLLDQ